MRPILHTVTAPVSLTLLAGCASSAASSSSTASTPSALVVERCTRCHPIERIKSAQHDATGWGATVTHMRTKGAGLSDAEAQQVIDFLASGGASKL